MCDAPWERLVDGHARARTAPTHEVADHLPIAAVLACSDARVPPSVVFDQPAGALFVIRLAGNTAAPSAVASLDYAVDALGIELIVVLGHTNCGAVGAAAAGTCQGHLEPIVAPICEIAKANPELATDQIAERNVAATVGALVASCGPTGVAARAGQVEIRGAVHDLRSGRLNPISTATSTPSRQTITTPEEAP